MNHNTKRTVEEKQKIIQEVERAKTAGEKAETALKRLGITSATYYGWRSKLAGKPAGEAREIVHRNGDAEKHLRIENQRLKMIVADQALDIQALKEWRAR